MKKIFIFSGLLLLSVAASIFWSQPQASVDAPDVIAAETQTPPQTAPAQEPLPRVPAAAAASTPPPVTSPVKDDSLAAMSQILSDYTKPDVPLKDLVDYLQASAQRPIVVHDSNPYTGEVAIVRTESPLPGTRYFTAQYYGDGNGDSYLQHMSFEFQPGPDAFANAVAAVQKQFNLGAPDEKGEGYVNWNLHQEGRVVWVKVLKASDLRDHPNNAYTVADIGTVRVAIEAEIH